MKTPPSAPEPFATLVERELGAPAGTGDWCIHETSRGLAGIALSGGGIRSATFNLGLLQGLQRLGLIGAFDYLSTVSGGGYIGGFWTRWRARASAAPNPAPRNGTFPAADARTGQQVEAEPVRHLREFSNFLTPRLGLLTVDTGRAVVAAVSAILPSLLAALSLMLLALLAWAAGAWLLLSGWMREEMGGWMAWATPSLLVLAGVLGLLLLAGEGMTPVDHRRGTWRPYLLATAVSVGAVSGTWCVITRSGVMDEFWLAPQRLPLVSLDPTAAGWGPLFLPCAALAAGALALLVLRVGTSRVRQVLEKPNARAAFDRAHSRLWLFAAVWAVVAALWCLGILATASRVPGVDLPAAGALAATAVALGAVFTRVQKALSKLSATPSGQMMARLRPLLPQLLSYAVIGLMAVVLVAVLAGAGHPGAGWAAADARVKGLAIGAAVVTVLALLLFNPNEVGLHAFYKGRLVRAYLGASCEPPNRSTGDVPSDDLFLDELPAGDRPFHLMCCAANDLSNAGELASLNRGATSAVLSRAGISVGTDWAEWGPDCRHVPTLGAAMTASGAAFNSLMGAKTIQFGPAVRFLAAALGLRLGLWIAHPRRIRAGQPPAPRPQVRVGTIPVVSDAGTDGAVPERRGMEGLRGAVGAFAARARETLRPWFVGAPFYRELLGFARADGPTVHLSDGGHFENMAVYELVRRHCLFIVASDCGQDNASAFEDVGNLVRKVREDFAVDIRIDLGPLRPDPATGLARQHMVAGDIHYPNGDLGVLLLFKPALVGSEPADVTQYRAHNPAFPHESTGDQFYDEAQWESYRRLGEHAATEAFGRIVGGLDVTEPADRAELFGRARFEWLPLPDGHADRAGGVGERIAALNALLRQEECRGLMEEVQIELAGLPAHPRPAGEPTARRQAREARERAASLDAVRHALRTLEEVYNAEDLERTHAHPVHLGLVNYFARWANARTVRDWWPVLRTLHGPPFARFVERLYGLGGGRPAARLTAAFDPQGYAAVCWRNQHGAAADDGGRRVVAYELRVGDRWLQAGLLRCEPTAARVAWDARDFYVAPGLWGVGLGTDLLSRLRDAEQLRLADAATKGREPAWLIVRVCDAGRAPQGIAADMQMYRQQGFAELTLDLRGTVLMDGRTHPTLELADLPADWPRGEGRWMVAARSNVAAVSPPPPSGAPASAPAEPAPSPDAFAQPVPPPTSQGD